MKSKLTQKLSAALLGLSLAGGVANADTTNVVTLTTFEYDPVPLRLRFSYAYHYQWPAGEPSGYSHSLNGTYYDPNDTGYTNAMGSFTFDNTVYADYMTANPSGGYGFGGGGGLNWTNDASVLISTNLENYILSFDLRAEGLKAGVNSAGVEFQLKFDAPDDTLSPPDGGTDFDTLIQLNFYPNAGSNWQHYVYTLDQGSIGGGSEANFITYLALCNGQSFALNLHMPDGVWGFDADNSLYIDNIRLDVVQTIPPPPPPPRVPRTFLDWNLDDKPLWYGAGGWNWAANANLPTGAYNIAAPSYGVGGSNAWVMWMTNSSMAADPPQWSGIGFNGAGPVDYSHFNSSELGGYMFSCDVRAEGLAPGKLSSSCSLQLFLSAPDDTIQPPDADTDRDTILQLNATIPAETNWQTFNMTFKNGAVGGGSKANFTNYFNKIDGVTVQFQYDNSSSEADWGYDDNNVVIIDNVKLERFYIACPPLNVQTLGNEVVVSWAAPSTGTVKLLKGTTPGTVNTEIPGATSPHTNAASSGPLYFRTLRVPPAP